jgi:hypothetical protein
MKIFTMLLAFTVLFGGTANAQSRVSRQLDEKAKKEILSPEIFDRCPNVSSNVSFSTKAIWDVLFSFNVSAGEQAVETDGTYIYTAFWSANGNITKWQTNGTLVETFTIPGVAAGIRDLAYDGTYFYGRAGATATSIYKMDFVNKTLVATIPMAGKTVRHLSYDPTLDGGNGGFWTGDWALLSSHKMDGSLIQTVTPPAGFAGNYGSTYDGTSVGGPYLWFFSQDAVAPQVDIVKYKISTNTIELTYDAAVVAGVEAAALAGGMGGSATLVPGKYVLLANFQQTLNKVVVFEVATAAAPTAPAVSTALTAVAEPAGALTANISWNNPALDVAGSALTELTSVSLYDAADMVTPIFTSASPVIGGAETFAATVAAAGTYTFKVIGTNSAGAGLPASVSVYIGEDKPAAPTNVVLVKNDMEAQLSWTAPVVGLNGAFFSGTGLTYDVVRYPGAVLVSDDQPGLTFTETLVNPANYYYKVTASNAIGVGGSANSNTLLFGDFLIYEQFAAAGIPSGWAAQGLGLTNWSVVATANAGGAANELRFYYSPSFTGLSSFVSPVINTTGMGALKLEFKHFIDWYTHTAVQKFGVATTIDDGATWTEVWSIDPTANVGPETKTLIINNAHVGSANFRLAFFFNGYSFDMDYWYIDNVELSKLPGANVTFNVTDGVIPVEGATVTVNSSNYITNAAGNATAFLLQGTYPYSVTAFGFEDFTSTSDVVVVDGVDQTENVALTALTVFDVTFNIENAIGDPLNATVTAYFGGVVVDSKTAVDGEAVFTDVPVGTYTYDVVMAGYTSIIGVELEVSAAVTVPVVMVEPMVIPNNLLVEVTGSDALFSWNNVFSSPLEISQHTGVGADGGYYQQFNKGYGVVYDLSAYPDAVILEVDFHHVSWGTMGTWTYKFHVANMTDVVSAHVTGNYTSTGNDTWELGVDLGSVEGLGGKSVGIFLQPFGNISTDAYPCVNTDGTANGASFFAVDLTTFVGTPSEPTAGDFIMDLWILTANGEKVKAPRKVANKALESYTVELDGVEVATGVTEESYLFEDLAVGSYTAGVKAVYTTGETAMVTIDFEIASSYTVTFNIVDEASAPITDATISFNGVDYPTGQYVFTGIYAGTYNYAIYKEGYDLVEGAVTVTNADVVEPITLIITGLNTNILTGLSTYPNPFSNQITISNPLLVSRMVVANLVGQVVMDVRTNGAATVETANLSTGIYLVTFEAANGDRIVRKMIKK